jgi:prepilin-type processing-associated H-X9-DG protein
VVIAIVAALASLLFSVGRQSIEKGESVKCASSLRQLGVNMQMYLAENNGIYPGSWGTNIWYVKLAPYYNITNTVPAEITAAMGKYCRCPTHNRRIKKLQPAISAADLSKPDYGLNFFTGKSTWIPDEKRNLKLSQLSKIMLMTECGFHAGGAVEGLDTYWLGGLPDAQGGAYTTGGVHAGRNNVLYADGHVEPLEIAPKDNPTRYTSQSPWDPIWGYEDLIRDY